MGLLGRNGAGKSTLMRILSSELVPEDGDRWVDPNVTVARLEQALPEHHDSTVFDFVAGGLSGTGELLSRYYELITDGSDAKLEELSQIQSELEHLGGWSMTQRIEKILQQLDLNGTEKLENLSGGWRRRVRWPGAGFEPDVLLLDEPTNHLDIPSIDWLEQQVTAFDGAIVTHHPRSAFSQRVCNRIGELDRGQPVSVAGRLRQVSVLREQQAEAKARAEALFDKKLAQEEAWIRQGIKARRTRNEGRVRALKAMRDERAQRRAAQGKGSFTSGRGQPLRSTRCRGAEHLLHYGDEPVVKDFSTIIQRGDRIGIVGSNGVGKPPSSNCCWVAHARSRRCTARHTTRDRLLRPTTK